jgi:hypothetical protein
MALSGISGVMVPIIPPVNDLASAISAINQINSLLPPLAGMGTGANNVAPQKPYGFSQLVTTGTLSLGGQALIDPGVGPGVGTGLSNSRAPARSRFGWVEQSRETEIVRITNPKDKSQYVDFTRIRYVLFASTKTNIQLLWKLHL